MPDDLLQPAREQAERSEPGVRVAAIMRIARVESALDRELARQTFAQALADIRRIAGADGVFLLGQARLIAAAVAPDLLADIPALDRVPRHVFSQMIGKIMLEHQHQNAALDYVVRYDEPSSFPFGVASTLIRSLDNDESRLAVLRSSITAWRTAREARHFHSFQFISLFQSQWKVLPLEEAAAVVHEIVRTAVEQPDQPITANYDPEGTVRITSGRANTLFQIFDVVRQVDGPMAESLIADNEQLAAALRRFPNGMQSVMEEGEARRAQTRRIGTGGGYAMAGSSGDFPYMRALIEASRDGDFGPAMQHAIDKYREDTGPERPNRAPKEFWPSTGRFRSVFYKAGKQLGHEAAVHLEAIPDPDLRLFAQIELAAALAGLPELPGVWREDRRPPDALRPQISHTPRADPGAAPAHLEDTVDTRIRCPKCQWSPDAESRWSCRCRHIWNTFQTRGVCPACGYQWTLTACLNCGQNSPHSEWYAKE